MSLSLPAYRPPEAPAGAKARTGLLHLAALAAWVAAYACNRHVARFLSARVLGLTPGTNLGAAVEFFVFEVPKVLLLLTFVVFVVGIVRSFFTPERTRSLLAGRRETAGNLLASLLGVVTPFCSCSAVPMFIGFVTAGVPLGVTFSFLVAAPMVNEVALALLFGLFGWKVAGLYLGTGLAIAFASGWVIGRLKLEAWVEPWVYRTRSRVDGPAGEKPGWERRLAIGREQVREIVGKVWLYVVAGIAVGAGIHGWVPENFMASIMGKGAWWSVPLAVLIGIPLYANAAGILPVVQALLGKGAALGTILAFMMSVIALSLPEMVILRKVLTPRLIAVFVGVVGTGILVVGYLFNALL
ncbi:MAG: permease [Thermoanaerobaculia bacterium]